MLLTLFLCCIYEQDVILKKRILKCNEVSDWVSYITVSETLCVRSHNKDAIRILQQKIWRRNFLDRWAFADMKNLKHVFNFFFIHHLIFIISCEKREKNSHLFFNTRTHLHIWSITARHIIPSIFNVKKFILMLHSSL